MCMNQINKKIKNIYSKRAILNKFSKEHAHIPLIIVRSNIMYIHGRMQKFS